MSDLTPGGHVLVTGASGFIGRALVLWLAAHGWRVRAAARDPTRVRGGTGIELAALPDLASKAEWGPLLEGVSHVVHLAGIAHSRASIAESTYQRVNAEAAGELARAARACGVARFVLMSSVRAQSGPEAKALLTERSNPVPTDAYGRSKLVAEASVRAELGAKAATLRPVLVLGPAAKGNLAALARIAHLPVPLPFGGLHNRRSVIGLSNLLAAVQFALTAEPAGGLFLVAEPEALSVAALLGQMRAAIGQPPRLLPVPPVLLRAGLALAGQPGLTAALLGDLIADSSALVRAGWRPATSLTVEIGRLMARQS